MKGLRMAVRFSTVSLRDELRKMNLYVFLGFVFLLIQFFFSGVGGYLRETAGRMNIWELYIWLMSSKRSQVICLLSILFLSGEVMNFHTETAYYLLRTNRRVWILSRILYLFFLIIGFQLFLQLSFFIACHGRVTVEGEWSRAALAAQRRSVAEIGIYPFVYAWTGFFQSDPNMLGGLTFLLSVLIGMFTGMVMMLAYMKNRAAYGIAAVFTLWFLDYLIESEEVFSLFGFFSPYALSRVSRLSLNYGKIPVWYAVAFLTCFLLLLFLWIRRVSEDIDFVKME